MKKTQPLADSVDLLLIQRKQKEAIEWGKIQMEESTTEARLALWSPWSSP